MSTKGQPPKKRPTPRQFFQPLMVNVVSLPRLVNRQQEDFVKIFEQTASHMRTTKIFNSNLMESHLRHKRKLEKQPGAALERTLKKLKIIANRYEGPPPPPSPRLQTEEAISFEVRRRLA